MLECIACGGELDPVHADAETHPSCDPSAYVGQPLDALALERYLAMKLDVQHGWTIVGEGNW